MKFARYLDENTVPEWKKVYIQYRGLKKLIKRVAEHRQARLLQEEQVQLVPTSSSIITCPSAAPVPQLRRRPSGGVRFVPGIHAGTSLAGSTGSLKRTDYGGIGDCSKRIKLDPISLVATGLRLPDHVAQRLQAFDHDSSDKDVEAQGISPPGLVADSSGSDVETIKLHPPSPVAIQGTDDSKPDPSPQQRPTSKDGSQPNKVLSKSQSFFTSRSARPQYAPMLDELMQNSFDEEECKLFHVADYELEKITTFYAARELDAARKYAQLARQLKELGDHRREFRANRGIKENERTHIGRHSDKLSQIFSTFSKPTGKSRDRLSDSYGHPEPHKGNLTLSHELEVAGIPELAQSLDSTASRPNGKSRQDSLDEDAGHRRREEALAKMQDSLRGWDDETDRAIREANRAAAMSHDPEAYAAARKKLKAAVLEYYKFLETLTNYKILNRTGFAKIMKKFSKTVNVPCTDAYYDARVAPSVLVTSDRIEKLIKSTEEIYAAYFEHGNRKQARDRLRIREEHTSHHFSVFRSGFYLGIALCATVAGLIQAMKPLTKTEIPEWQGLMRIYGAELIPIAFALLFGLNLAWWHHARINTVFIFEWDVRNTMDYRQFFEIPSLFMLLLSLCFWLTFLNPFPQSISPTTWPVVWLVAVLVVMLNPLPIMLRESRAWFIRSILRVFTAGYMKVEFRDFFLGDELNSVVWSISNLWYFGCEWKHGWASPDQCNPNTTYWTAALYSVPAALRLGQCIRRWMVSDYQTHLHLVNVGKYASAIVNNFVYYHYRFNGSTGAVNMTLWIVFGCIYSVWHILWDLIMDWSLLKPRAKYWLLRDDLAFPVFVYYVFIVVDIVIRFIWLIYLIPGPGSITLRSFLAALLEMIRRACWNNLRVENEQIGNTDSFKVIRDLPLPYRQMRKTMDEDLTVDSAKIDRKGIFASVKLATLRKKKSLAAAFHVDGNPGEGEIHNPTDRNVNGTTPSLMEKLRKKLVPDAKVNERGLRIDEQAATKGNSGRDYTPRALEVDGDSDLGSSTTPDEEQEYNLEETRTGSGTHR